MQHTNENRSRIVLIDLHNELQVRKCTYPQVWYRFSGSNVKWFYKNILFQPVCRNRRVRKKKKKRKFKDSPNRRFFVSCSSSWTIAARWRAGKMKSSATNLHAGPRTDSKRWLGDSEDRRFWFTTGSSPSPSALWPLPYCCCCCCCL